MEGETIMIDRTRRLTVVRGAAAVLFAAFLWGCGGDSGTEPEITNSVQVDDQTANPANRVIVGEVIALEDGWIVVHEVFEGASGAVLGYAAVSEGTHTNVEVTLSRDVSHGETLHAMLHVDAGTIGAFEFPGADGPALDAGALVLDAFVVFLGSSLATIRADDQTADNLSTIVTVAEAFSNGPGWVVVHEDKDGEFWTTLGWAQLDSGANADIKVVLNRPVADGESLHAMLHADYGDIGTYQYSGVDPPVTDGTGAIIVDMFQVTVPEGTPAIRIQAVNIGDAAYDFVAVEPEEYFADVHDGGGGNQTLTLTAGWRYEIVNLAYQLHPIELMTTGMTPAEDVILLSQAVAGSLETDGTIGWYDNENTIRFTLSESLEAVLDGYRCAPHFTTMRGSLVVQDQ